MTFAGSMRRNVCALIALAATAVVATADEVNDYPTAARSEYVFGCLKANGETRQAISGLDAASEIVHQLGQHARAEVAAAALHFADCAQQLRRRAIFQHVSASSDLHALHKVILVVIHCEEQHLGLGAGHRWGHCPSRGARAGDGLPGEALHRRHAVRSGPRRP